MELFVIKLLGIYKKKDKEIKRDFINLQQTTTHWKQKSITDYKEYLKKAKMHQYKTYSEMVGVYVDYKTAEEVLTKPTTDLSEGGLYNYAVIIKVPSDTLLHYENIEQEQVTLFKLDKENYTKTCLTESGIPIENIII